MFGDGDPVLLKVQSSLISPAVMKKSIYLKEDLPKDFMFPDMDLLKNNSKDEEMIYFMATQK